MMNFLNRRTSWTNTEIGILKVCLVSFGISIGAYFGNILRDYILIFGIIYLVAGMYCFYLWVKKMKE